MSEDTTPEADAPPSFKLSASETARVVQARADLDRLNALYRGELVQIAEAESALNRLMVELIESHGAPPNHGWQIRIEGDDVFLDGVENGND